MSRACGLLFILVVTLAIAASGVLIGSNRTTSEDERRAAEFHTLVGGLGFGPAIDASICEFSFDPRLCPSCSFANGSIPGGVFFCPHHACPAFTYPSPSRWEPRTDAIPP